MPISHKLFVFQIGIVLCLPNGLLHFLVRLPGHPIPTHPHNISASLVISLLSAERSPVGLPNNSERYRGAKQCSQTDCVCDDSDNK
eukprot:465266-Pyramimonas_sp.AAC.1